MNKLGKDYNDPEWEKLLNQMSPDEMAKLVVLGGYCTQAVEFHQKDFFLSLLQVHTNHEHQ